MDALQIGHIESKGAGNHHFRVGPVEEDIYQMKAIRKLLPLLKPYWLISVIALVLLIGAVGMELAIPRLIQRIVDQGISANDMQVVVRTSLLMLGITFVNLIFATGNSVLSVMVGEGFSRDLRQHLFSKIQELSFGNLDKLKTGQLIVRMTSDVEQVQRMVQIMLRIGTRAPLMMIGSIILMVQTSSTLSLYLLPLLFALGIVIVFVISRIGPLFMSVQKKLDSLNTVLQENLAGVRVVKAFVRSDYEIARFEQTNKDYMEWSIKVLEFMSVLMPMVMLLMNIGIVLVIWQGGFQALAGDLTVGEIIAFTNYLLSTMMPLMILAMIASVLATAGVSAIRVVEVLDDVPQIQDPATPLTLPFDAGGRVVFENVCFSYDGNCSEPVLQNIDLVAEPGQTIAILGSTGAGKSSLVNLIPRFYDATVGSVSVDGIDVRQLDRDTLLAQIGVVLQENILFSGTIRDNIRYGHPDATEEQVVAAAKAAQAHDFIMTFPDGYDTQVAERGVNLSGGQKQRLAIARALILQPKILILDDSTSSVDVETEGKIQEALDTMTWQRTSFVVAQRISTVLNADQIVVMDKGRIVAQGTHKELLRASDIYQEIYESQLGNGVVAYG
jgi:ATP-binding cassette subfamily B multidrug efflux pump